MKPNAWTPDEEAWLREVYPDHSNAEIARMHAERFPDRPKRTPKAINSRAKVYRLHKSESFVRNPPTVWTPERCEWFRSFVPGHTESEISAEHERVFGTPLTEGQIGNAKTNLGVRSGTHGGQFQKGHEPFNKGRKWTEYGTPEGHERSRATQFRKGELSGIAKERVRPVGYERVDAEDGYTWVKVKDTPQAQVPGSFNDNFRLKHHVAYEQAYGPIPEGCNVVFADHDKRNLDPSNLVAVPRGIWAVMRHRGLEYHDRETLLACMAVAALDRARYAAECSPRACKRCGAEFRPRFKNQRTCDACLGR